MHPIRHRRVLVTGGAGFIGSALIRQLLSETDCYVLNYDLLTYAGNLASLPQAQQNARYQFVQADIGDRQCVAATLAAFQPDAIVHLAAESHVDRSIDTPAGFIATNIAAAATLLQEACNYWRSLDVTRRASFRFLNVSTDEVYGSLGAQGRFSETTPYAPRSPYSASKAAFDHLVQAWFHTYGFPVLITNCSNNYGPFQFPEKLIPLTILNALELRPLPLYGSGAQVRDWLHVDDHVRALRLVLAEGAGGAMYNVGSSNEHTNLAVVEAICDHLDALKPRIDRQSFRSLITFVADRPGHDQRYAIDATRISTELGWQARQNFTAGLLETIHWYLDNAWWWQPIRQQRYAGERLGVEHNQP